MALKVSGFKHKYVSMSVEIIRSAGKNSSGKFNSVKSDLVIIHEPQCNAIESELGYTVSFLA